MTPRAAAAPTDDPVIALLLRQLHRAFDVRSWHGTNLMGSLRGLDRELLVWRPRPGRHNVAELALHAAYWKYRAHRLLTDAPPRAFELPGSDFFERSTIPTAAEWQADLALLRTWHERLADAVAALPPKRLEERPAKSEYSRTDLVLGAAAHDLYHAGQIQLLKRLYAKL